MSKVDVLAVLKDVIRYESRSGSPDWIAELNEVRAAVAELIAATTEVWAALDSGADSEREYLAEKRCRAALAKATGASA